MRKEILFTFILAGMACLIFAQIQESEAQNPIFFADFDGKGIPDNTVNTPAKYKAENPANTWGIGDFLANKTKALQMTGGGCGSSSFTPFPGVEDWTDGIIQIDMGWNDDDSWGIMFRREDEATGYFAFFGWIETVNLALFDLAELGLANGQCLSEAGAENGVEPGGEIIDKFLDVIPHDFKKMTTGPAAVSYTGRILADGDTIKVWYGLTEDFPDDPLQEPTKIPVMLEVKNSAHTQGSVGIWHESNDNGIIDNIYVFDEKGLAVAPKGKLTTTWGVLKTR